jgi:hypothetical protein
MKLDEACMLFEPKRPCNHANKSFPVNWNVCKPHKNTPDKLTSFAATRNDDSKRSIDEGYTTVSWAESDNYSLYYHMYNKDDPKIPLIESLQGKTNFFKKWVSKYAKSGVGTKETTLERQTSHPTLQ